MSYEIYEHSIPGFTHTKAKNLINFTIESNPDVIDSIVIQDDVFIFMLDPIGYFHVMQDVVSEFEFLKSLGLAKDIKLLALARNQEEYDYMITNYGIIVNILRKYNIDGGGNEMNNVIRLDKLNKIIIQSAWFITTDFCRVLSDNINPPYHIPTINVNQESFLEYLDYSVAGAKLAWDGLIPKSPISNKKIYISRRKENDSLRQVLRNTIDEKTGQLDANKLKDKMPWIDDDFVYNIETKFLQRYISLYDENAIENFLIDQGFEVVFIEDYYINEQIAIFSEADEIVSLEGGGIYNCIFVKPECKVHIIATTNCYDFWYRELMNAAKVKLSCIPFNNEIIFSQSYDDKRKYFNSTDIIKDLKLAIS